ncbi:MAG: L-ectoine synthase [Thermoleophilaceae bacterium]|jgi:hypothetical protein|nr:L-ectoine synthase [Thermoleophilaceae bacterium]
MRAASDLRPCRTRTLALLAGTIALLVPSAASGTHYDNMFRTAYKNGNCSTSSFCQTDNAALTVHRGGSLSDSGKANIAWTLDNSYTTTDLNVSYDSTATYTGSAETDIIYYVNGGLPSTTLGVTWCDDPLDDGLRCDQHYVAFHYDTPAISLACHETGHAVGLTHGDEAFARQPNDEYDLQCMRQPASSSTQYVGHNAGWIDVTY